MDGLDPVYAPGTGTPEIGGYTTHDAQVMLRGLRGLDIVGGDVVEVSPPFDMSGSSSPGRGHFDVRDFMLDGRADRDAGAEVGSRSRLRREHDLRGAEDAAGLG